MALRLTGGLVMRAVKPILVNPCFTVPNTLNLQVRYAARKGYREAKKRKKKEIKLKAPPSKEIIKLKKKFSNIRRTVESDNPNPPNDDVFLQHLFKTKKYSIIEAVNFHKEYHHPTVFDNPDATIFTRIEFNMTGKKKTQFIKPFKGISKMPNPFKMGMKRDILVLCEPQYVQTALDCGASVAGGLDLVAKIKEGTVLPNAYEFIMCHTNFFPEITPIRGLLGLKLPKLKIGTLTRNLTEMIPKFLHGVEYSCVKLETTPDFGLLDCQIGTIDMEAKKIEENFKALLEDINQFRPPRDGPFITWITCRSPPSKEEFAIDVSLYVSDKKDEDEDDLEDEPEVEKSSKKDTKDYLKDAEQEQLEQEILNK